MAGIPATWKVKVGGSLFEASLGKNGRPYLKNKLKAKRTGDMVQVVECLSA
jgi:hypothetical protein